MAFVTMPDSIIFDSHGHMLKNFREGKLRWSTQFTYDKNGCLLKTSSGNETIATFTCNEKGLTSSSYTLEGGITTTYVYDAKGLLQSEYSRPADATSKATRSSTKYYYSF
jgi:YD repeat-containing protein